MLETKRLKIRQWRTSDVAEFISLNQDSAVMKYFPALMSDQEVLDMVDRCSDSIQKRGWGFFAVEERDSEQFIGMVGLNEVPFELPSPIQIEVGWRLAKAHWGKGFAVEAAQACIEFAFENMPIGSLCAFTPSGNLRSRRVMEKLGMRNLNQPFMHPRIEADHPLAEHELYAITREQHMQTRNWDS